MIRRAIRRFLWHPVGYRLACLALFMGVMLALRTGVMTLAHALGPCAILALPPILGALVLLGTWMERRGWSPDD